MHIPALRTIVRLTALAAVVAISIVTAGSSQSVFNKSQKAFYADPQLVAFVRPGLVLTITSANVASDGSMTAAVTIADPKGLPLDKSGVMTPGPVAVNCTVAALPKNSNNFASYTLLPSFNKQTGITAQVSWFDEAGVWTKGAADGQYSYAFSVKAPSGFDITASHRVACSATRDLTEFSMGTFYAGATLDFVPGSKTAPTQVHDVVRTAACAVCHQTLAYHGGNATGAEMCVVCHTNQVSDSATGNSLYFPVLIHKLHMGSSLPSVKAGKAYQFVGYGGAVTDFSSNAYPSDPGQCQTCHDAKFGAAQAKNYITGSNRAACGACHDDVNFATGQNHVNLPQADDSQCSTCHVAQGELPLDASILGAHINPATLNPDSYSWVPGMVLGNLQVQNGVAGKAPTINFSLKDKSGNPIALSELKTSPGRLAAVLGGPTKDYGYVNFGSDVATGGYVSEDATAGTCDANGNCSYTFKHIIPANATGTYSIGLEGRRKLTILGGTTAQVTGEYGAHNQVINFSVDGSPIVARRTIVSLDKCNGCHTYLSLHGTNRDRIEQCVICHNGSETDAVTRAQSTNAVQKAMPAQAVDFPYMIHHIHGGADVKAYTGAGYSVVGFGGSFNDFSNVRYPTMHTNGSTGNIGACDMCHVNGSEQVLPEGLNAMINPQGKLNPTPATTAACTACHATTSALSHAMSNTSQLGESCSVCHGANGDYAVDKMHAQ